MHVPVNSEKGITVIVVMEDLYHALTSLSNQDIKQSVLRKLKRLRILLMLWLVSFVVSLIWFYFSIAFKSLQ